MSVIQNVLGIEVLDSRGVPTIQATIELANGLSASSIVPSGASTGRFEACELRDEEDRYFGRGVTKALSHVNTDLKALLVGQDVHDITLDERMCTLDGTRDKSHFGANAILALSLTLAKLAAKDAGHPLYQYLHQRGHGKMMSLPIPFLNVLNGGIHADNPLNIQEFMIVPHGLSDFQSALRAGCEVYHTLKGLLKAEALSVNVGDEGGFAPQLQTMEQACELLLNAIEKAGYQPYDDISLALDLASSEFYHKGLYHCDGQAYDRQAWVECLERWVSSYPILSLEDPCAEEDWEGWAHLTEHLKDRCRLIGDDLFVTQTKRLKEGVEKNVANAILIKPNQVGTLGETLSCMAYAHQHGYQQMVSHRSGDSEDTFIADLAVATGCGAIKTGAPSRSERVAKYNRLLSIAAATDLPLARWDG